MFKHQHQLRVRYSETDQMGFVYYGNYAQYFEVARVEALRSLKLSYKELEENGIMLPVRSFQIDYFKPAHYDDLLTIETLITEMPSAKLSFEYRTLNEQGEVLNTAKVLLVFMNSNTNRPMKPPSYFVDRLKPFFS